jgi:BolA protein
MVHAQQIHAELERSLAPKVLNVKDDGARHKRHKEAQAHGGGHFVVYIVADAFEGMRPVARHQLVYKTLGMPRPDIHALSIQAKAPSEVDA